MIEKQEYIDSEGGLTQQVSQNIHTSFRDKQNYTNIFTPFFPPLQDIENLAFQILEDTDLENATENGLSKIGTLLGIPREGLSKEDYKKKILLELAIRNSRGTADSILGVVSSIVLDSDQDGSVKYNLVTPYGYSIKDSRDHWINKDNIIGNGGVSYDANYNLINTGTEFSQIGKDVFVDLILSEGDRVVAGYSQDIQRAMPSGGGRLYITEAKEGTLTTLSEVQTEAVYLEVNEAGDLLGYTDDGTNLTGNLLFNTTSGQTGTANRFAELEAGFVNVSTSVDGYYKEVDNISFDPFELSYTIIEPTGRTISTFDTLYFFDSTQAAPRTIYFSTISSAIAINTTTTKVFLTPNLEIPQNVLNNLSAFIGKENTDTGYTFLDNTQFLPDTEQTLLTNVDTGVENVITTSEEGTGIVTGEKTGVFPELYS